MAQFFGYTGHNDIPDPICTLWQSEPDLDIEHAGHEPSSALVWNDQAFAFGPEEEDGELIGWSWASWELEDGQWLPMTGGDGSVGPETDELEAAARAWVDASRPEAETTGEDLIAFRTALGMSQRDLALLLDVGQPAITRWESGARAVPDRLRFDLDQILADFQEDVWAWRDGGVPSVDAPWETVARFWAGHGGVL